MSQGNEPDVAALYQAGVEFVAVGLNAAQGGWIAPRQEEHASGFSRGQKRFFASILRKELQRATLLG